MIKRWRDFAERVLLKAEGEAEKEQIKRRITEIDRLLAENGGVRWEGREGASAE